MGFELRLATPDDAEGIERVRVAGWKTAYRGVISGAFLDALVVDTRRRRRALTDGNATRTQLVAVDDRSHVVGWTGGGPSRDLDCDPDTVGEVYACYVDPGRWRAGVGRTLMERAVSDLSAAGFAEITLWVLKANTRARQFYEAMGFVADGSARSFYAGGPVPEVRYRRPAATGGALEA